MTKDDTSTTATSNQGTTSNRIVRARLPFAHTLSGHGQELWLDPFVAGRTIFTLVCVFIT
jgi:hypothetical protein